MNEVSFRSLQSFLVLILNIDHTHTLLSQRNLKIVAKGNPIDIISDHKIIEELKLNRLKATCIQAF